MRLYKIVAGKFESAAGRLCPTVVEQRIRMLAAAGKPVELAGILREYGPGIRSGDIDLTTTNVKGRTALELAINGHKSFSAASAKLGAHKDKPELYSRCISLLMNSLPPTTNESTNVMSKTYAAIMSEDRPDRTFDRTRDLRYPHLLDYLRTEYPIGDTNLRNVWIIGPGGIEIQQEGKCYFRSPQMLEIAAMLPPGTNFKILDKDARIDDLKQAYNSDIYRELQRLYEKASLSDNSLNNIFKRLQTLKWSEIKEFKISLFQGSLELVALEDEFPPSDLIICTNVFQWVDMPQENLQDYLGGLIKNHLVYGGRLIITRVEFAKCFRDKNSTNLVDNLNIFLSRSGYDYTVDVTTVVSPKRVLPTIARDNPFLADELVVFTKTRP